MRELNLESVFCFGALALSTMVGAISVVLAVLINPLFALGVIPASAIFKTGCLGLDGVRRAFRPNADVIQA